MNESPGLKLTDALDVKGRAQILGDMNVEPVSIRIDEAGSQARHSGQSIVFRSRPYTKPIFLDEVFDN